MPVNGNWEQLSHATPSAEGLAVGIKSVRGLTVIACLKKRNLIFFKPLI